MVAPTSPRIPAASASLAPTRAPAGMTRRAAPRAPANPIAAPPSNISRLEICLFMRPDDHDGGAETSDKLLQVVQRHDRRELNQFLTEVMRRVPTGREGGRLGTRADDAGRRATGHDDQPRQRT